MLLVDGAAPRLFATEMQPQFAFNRHPVLNSPPHAAGRFIQVCFLYPLCEE
jgi:hypothetical protein